MAKPTRSTKPVAKATRRAATPKVTRPTKPAAKTARRSATPKRAVPRGAERRIAERAPVMVLEIRGKSYDKIFVGYAENISRSGLFFSAANPPAVGSTFPVEFVLPDNRTVVQCTCRVVWQHRYNTTGRPSVGVGVEFVDLDALKRTLIDQWVTRKVVTSRGAPNARR
jgi:uncharacterized protein (TIGR02266 family)